MSALSTLTNVQNSLFIPNLGPLLNRNQTYTLSPPSPLRELETTSDEEPSDEAKEPEVRPSLEHTLTSVIAEAGEPRFAVLPEGSDLAGWSQEEIEELNDHVRHMLHSRRSKFKRSMKGFRKYVSKRKYAYAFLYRLLTFSRSPWIPRYPVCHTDYTFWTCLGAISDWYDSLRASQANQWIRT